MGQAAGPADPGRSAMHRPRGECRVLVIDDNADAADTVAMFLESEGFLAAVGYCAEDAFRETDREPVDVAILDIGLPDMNGYEIASALRGRADRPLLIAVTGWGSQADIDKAFAAGFDFHFTKPAPLPEILAILNHRCVGEGLSYDPERGRQLRPVAGKRRD